MTHIIYIPILDIIYIIHIKSKPEHFVQLQLTWKLVFSLVPSHSNSHNVENPTQLLRPCFSFENIWKWLCELYFKCLIVKQQNPDGEVFPWGKLDG